MSSSSALSFLRLAEVKLCAPRLSKLQSRVKKTAPRSDEALLPTHATASALVYLRCELLACR